MFAIGDGLGNKKRRAPLKPIRNVQILQTRQDKTRQDKTRQDKRIQDQDKTKTRQRQDKTRQDKTRQDKTRQDTLRFSYWLMPFAFLLANKSRCTRVQTPVLIG